MAPSAIGAHGPDESGSRCDGDEADDYGGGRADRGRPALACVVEDRPHDERSHRGEEGRDEREAGDWARRERAAGVEAEPAEPEQAGTEQRERHVVRQQRRARIVAALAHDDRGHQRGDAGVHVDDRAAREIERAHVGQPAAAPYPVRHRRVDERAPRAR